VYAVCAYRNWTKMEPYLNFNLWNGEAWNSRLSRIEGLASYLGNTQRIQAETYRKPQWTENEEKEHYHNKTGSIDDPKVLENLYQKGLTCSILDLTMHWIAVCPGKEELPDGRKLPGLMIFLQTDYEDYYWAMKALTQYEHYLDQCAQKKMILLFAVSNNGPDTARTYVNVIQEACTLFPLNPNEIYVDVTPCMKAGIHLSEIDNFHMKTREGKDISDPDSMIQSFFDDTVYALPVSGNWEDRGSLGRDLVMSDKYSLISFDREAFIQSESGRRMMEGITFEYLFDSVEDTAVARWLEQKGVHLEIHVSKGERWLTLEPLHSDEKLPLFCVMQEVYYGNEHQAVTAIGYFEEMVELTAQNKCITLFYVMEDPDSNDHLAQLIDEAGTMLPIDLTRVYVTGHSHDGRFALEFSVRNWKKIAAVATLGNFMGLEDPKVLGDPRQSVSDETISKIKTFDLPCANFCGCMEHGGKLPINVDARTLPLRPGQQFGRTITREDRISSWQRRLDAWNCEVATSEQIIACTDSDFETERILGFPVDQCDVRLIDGWKHYIGDLKNKNGKYHLRMVAVENCPHIPSPAMLDLAWEFCSSFARNSDGTITELFA